MDIILPNWNQGSDKKGWCCSLIDWISIQIKTDLRDISRHIMSDILPLDSESDTPTLLLKTVFAKCLFMSGTKE